MISYSSVKDVVSRSLPLGGRQVSATRFEWDISGRCSKPVRVNLHARKQKGRIFAYTPGETPPPLEMDMDAPCRKCPWCLRNRARLWADRAKNEFLLSSRVWFGTLTLNQEARTRNLMKAHQLARHAGVDLESAPAAIQSKYRHRANVQELAKWLKRVRKNANTRFRYLLCSEDHEDGTPHYHVLIFESFMYSQIGKRTLDGAWKLGFSQFRLADISKATYVTKYLTKSSTARVRASSNLGNGPRPMGIANAVERDKPTPRNDTEEGPGMPEGSPVVA